MKNLILGLAAMAALAAHAADLSVEVSLPANKQGAVLAALEARPLLDLGMRLGEGSGAAVAVPLLRLACTLHNEMATFAEAQVSRPL